MHGGLEILRLGVDGQPVARMKQGIPNRLAVFAAKFGLCSLKAEAQHMAGRGFEQQFLFAEMPQHARHGFDGDFGFAAVRFRFAPREVNVREGQADARIRVLPAGILTALRILPALGVLPALGILAERKAGR